MPQSVQKAEFNNFSKGLITEFSELNFPENAFKEGVNFELNKDGSLSRRLGMDLEDNSEFHYTSINTSSVSTNLISFFTWENAGGDSNTDFIVVQARNRMYVYDPNVENISADGLVTSFTLTEMSSNAKFSIANVKGSLIVAGGANKIGLVKYDAVSKTFSTSYFKIKTRDFWGVPCKTIPEYDEDQQYRGAFDLGHIYNLYNQSWGVQRKNKKVTTVVSEDVPFEVSVIEGFADPTSVYFSKYGVYPSDSETVWPGMQFQAGSEPYERMFVNLYAEVLGADNVASKGYFIIDVLERGPSREEAFAANGERNEALAYKSITLDKDTTSNGASVVCEYAGRVVYAGFNGSLIGGTNKSPELSDYVFFSQLVRNERDYGKCYQEGDPTSRESSDIVDTDGGYVRVSGAKKIVGMRSLGDALVVVATNGVWVIQGGNDNGFTATNYKVTHITRFGCNNERSIVDDGEQLLYWGDDGIFAVSRTQMGSYQVTSLSEKTIQTFYNSISSKSKQTAYGSYDMFAKKVRWVYQESEPFSQSKELVLDLNLGAFYPFAINGTTYCVLGSVSLPAFRSVDSEMLVEVEGVSVIANGISVIANQKTSVQNVQSLRYLVLKDDAGVIKYSFAYYKDDSFLDWQTEDAYGYFVTADFTAKDSSINKQIPFIVTHMRFTDTGVVDGERINSSGCMLSTRWDWSTRAESNKWTTPREIYRPKGYLTISSFNPGFALVTFKDKIRGIGKAVALKFETEENKDCKLVGWSLTLNGNSKV